MSLRPRFGGEGYLIGPDEVTVGRDGAVMGVFRDRAWDPFERTSEELLLAESFARFDFRRPRKAQQWFLDHGVVDVASMFPDLYQAAPSRLGVEVFGDRMNDVLEQQRAVRWHLSALARLSAERHRAGPRRPDRAPHEGWDPAWASVALRVPDGTVLWLAANTREEGPILPEMQRYARYEDVPDRRHLPDPLAFGHSPETMAHEWWPAAHGAWRRIEREAIPVLWYPDRDLIEDWPFPEASWDPHVLLVGRGVGTDWHGLMEIERRLLRSYVRRAAPHDVEIRVVRTAEPAPDEPRGDRWYGTIEIEEQRRWRSLLAPVYLQLLEALLRISEGRSGAALCRECGQPFLTLDARRSAFCNDRERYRFTQRRRRERLREDAS